jgi:hypothetical protein
MRRFLFTTIVVSLFLPRTALALDWEIERNFRYFLYPSDVAVQRVARDIYIEKHGSPPNAEQFEALINGPGFWTQSSVPWETFGRIGRSTGLTTTRLPPISFFRNCGPRRIAFLPSRQMNWVGAAGRVCLFANDLLCAHLAPR